MEEKVFESFDGTLLSQYVFECENPKAIIQIAHGMQEYSATYFAFANFLSQNGYMVVLFDQRAHGKSVDILDLGKVNKERKNPNYKFDNLLTKELKEDIFVQTVSDHLYMTRLLKQKYNLPVYFLGHSYGSFIGQAYLEKCTQVDKVVLIGSCYMKKPLVVFGRVVAGLIKNIKGSDTEAKFVEKLSFNSYKKKFSDASWITSDEQETKAFYDDERNGTPFSYGFYNYMFKNQLKHPRKKALEKINKKMPVLLLGGQDDVVGDMGKGSTKLFNFYKKNNLNIEFKLYQNKRHALLQETNKKEIYEEILTFFEKKQ